VDAALDRTRSQLAIHAEAFAGGAQQRQQQDGEGVQEQEAITALRIVDSQRAHAHSEAQVFAVSKARLDIPLTLPLII
jgi:hypothetical protein